MTTTPLKIIAGPAVGDTLGMELHFAATATWRIEMFLEAWIGAPSMTETTREMVAIAQSELSTRN